MHKIQFKVLAHSFSDIKIDPSSGCAEAEPSCHLKNEDSHKDIINQLIGKLLKDQDISDGWLDALTIQTSSKILPQLLTTLSKKQNHSLLSKKTTEMVLTRFFIFHFSFTPNDDFYKAAQFLFTKFISNFDTLKHHLYHTALFHVLELKNCDPFKQDLTLSLTPKSAKAQLKPLQVINQLTNQVQFRLKLNKKFPNPEHCTNVFLKNDRDL